MSGAVCRYFQAQGKCFYGSDCKYEHVNAGLKGAGAGDTVPAAAAAAAAGAAAPRPLSSFSAGAKEWTPSGSASFMASPSPPPRVGSTGLGTSKLNPNKTPFKPTTGSGSGGGGSGFSNQAAEFVPAAQQLHQLQASAAHFEPHEQQGHEVDEHGQPLHHELDQQQQWDPSMGAAEDVNPYAQQYGSSGAELLADASGAGSLGGVAGGGGVGMHAFVPPSAYTTHAEFAKLSHSSAADFAAAAAGGSGGVDDHDEQEEEQVGDEGGGMFVDDALRARVALEAYLHSARLQPDDPRFTALPTSLDHDRYHSLMPLEPDVPSSEVSAPAAAAAWHATTSGGSECFKVISAIDGRAYVVKRLTSCRLSEEAGRVCIQSWLDFAAKFGSGSAPPAAAAHNPASARSWGRGPCHPGVVAVRGAFHSKDFGLESDPAQHAPGSLCLVYDFLPTAQAVPVPLASAGGDASAASSPAPLSADLIFHYAVQLISTISDVHEARLSCEGLLRPGRILVTSEHRLQLSGAGLAECLAATGGAALNDAALSRAHTQDWRHVGLLLLCWMGRGKEASSLLAILARGAAARPGSNAATSASNAFMAEASSLRAGLEQQQQQQAGSGSAMWPADLVALVHLLLATPEPRGPQVLASISRRLSRAYVSGQSQQDYLSHELSKELDNGRWLRLLIKLGFVCDRPEWRSMEEGGDGSLGPTGGKLLLPLFRDLVFNSVHSGAGGGSSSLTVARASASSAGLVPNLDWGHVLHQLSLLDSGAPEKTLLTSPQGDTMLLTSYAQIKHALQQAYDELQGRMHAHEADDEQPQHQQHQYPYAGRAVLRPHK